ncbi:FAD/NAD(P)-binding domain-containing protein [Dissoconium aciculare CBS 342.82]|jgi:predicted NAD/FAD-binding protein|uniref:FAD/NAD(P)-binding domain-containing protein n=1 Tax=Dissoconium aciculare CBS 342.82 TaxID=1314786 RepID=A0A6J3LZ28_9PEZI|nr:FAD/NAD(P)-binding domain-containing protein [Dissoconium aciculare CBS 342.82]KAF1821030.1 FAD/NAD(P)-binding domain-containing protein [Dissoconium aciculare CBS 342.82]
MNIFRRKDPAANSSKKRSSEQRRTKVAIVGSGSAGIGALWALKDSDYDVHLFEKSSKLGGHTNTQPWRIGEETAKVDTGFIVLNAATYPNFIRFLEEIGIEPTPTEMTFSVSRDRGVFEWSGEPHGIFAQRRNIFRPEHWRMIFDIVRFNQFALDVLNDDDETLGPELSDEPAKAPLYPVTMSIGEYLDKEGYSKVFRDDYLIPMTAAVWSTSPDKCTLEFPARTLIRFMWNHHLLSTVAERPRWLTIAGGSQQYIDAVLKVFPKKRLHVHKSCEVANIVRPTKQDDAEVALSWIDGTTEKIEHGSFDHVVLACHGDEILPLFAKRPTNGESKKSRDSSKKGRESSKKSRTSTETASSSASSQHAADDEEEEILSAFQTTENICYLHSDLDFMPKRPNVWTSWNYLVNSKPSEDSHPAGVSLTYNMNILQHIPRETFGHVLVTMNPEREPNPELTQGKFTYRHPLYTAEAVLAQQRLETIQNVRGVSYCGAWTKYGFHEDGFSSGLKVAMDHLDAKLPFEFVDSTFSRGRRPVLVWQDYVARALLSVLLVGVRLIDAFVALPVISWIIVVIAFIASMLLNILELVGLL